MNDIFLKLCLILQSVKFESEPEANKQQVINNKSLKMVIAILSD